METFDAAEQGSRVKSRQSGLRTVDVARRAGYSVQQIRVLEQEGVLPAAERSASGYRSYTETHVQAALAYRAFAAAVGPVEAKKIMRAAGSELHSLIEAAFASLHFERDGLRLAQEAAAAIAGEPMDAPRPGDAMGISELASALGLRPSTLRYWEGEGLVTPGREAGQRVYSPADVREVRIVQQLRRAGYGIPQLRGLLPELRHTHAKEALASRAEALDARSRHLLRAVALLDPLLP